MYNEYDRFNITGKIIETRFSDTNNFYKVLTIEVLKQENLSYGKNYLSDIEILTGIIEFAEIGTIIDCEVEVVNHRRYGAQLQLTDRLAKDLCPNVKCNADKQIEKEFIQASSNDRIFELMLQKIIYLATEGNRKLKDIFVLTPQEYGELGRIHLNKRLQKFLNPSDRTKYEICFEPDGSRTFRVGDPVITVVDNEEKQVNSGEIGIIEAVYENFIPNDTKVPTFEQVIEVSFSDQCSDTGRKIVQYKNEKIKQLELSYALTSELLKDNKLPVVIMPLYKYRKEMTHYNLIYNALDSAEENLIVMGDKVKFPDLINDVMDNKVNSREEIVKTTISQCY